MTAMAYLLLQSFATRAVVQWNDWALASEFGSKADDIARAYFKLHEGF